ncbi:peptidoglycan-binding protein [Kitasatospora sp. NPDC050543]|uniref:peptidoglycan-binding protein n=1 Tax=Kitasatospora sp. NPDC050543 TaxID=3364054 RepID=UPI003791E98C
MPDVWMPGAERHDIGDHAPTDQQYPPRAIAHITWDKNATPSNPQDWESWEDLVSYFTGSGKASAPHIVWDPFTGRVAQLVPANSRSKSVMDLAGGTRTNRAGSVVIQVEAVFFPNCRYGGKVYQRLVDTPCAGWDRLHAWIASWGVPDVWPMGRPVDFTSRRDEHTWETQGGWYAHAHVPENDHQDPGSWPALGGGSPPAPPSGVSREQVSIGGLTYGYGAHGDQVTLVGRALVAVGFGSHYASGPGPDWTDADTLNYADYQCSLGYTGDAADGVPGETSLRRLLGSLPIPTTPAPTPIEEDDLPFTKAELAEIASNAVPSAAAADRDAYAAAYLLAYALAGEAPPGADDSVKWLSSWFHQAFQSCVAAAVQPAVAAAVGPAVAEALASGITLTVNTKS